MDQNIDTIPHFLMLLKKKFPFIQEEDIETGLKLIKLTHFPPNSFYIQKDQLITKAFVVLNGLFKCYYIDENGNEVIVGFYFDNHLSKEWLSVFIGETGEKKSKFYIETVEPTWVGEIYLEEIEELAQTNPRFAELYRVSLKEKFTHVIQGLWDRINTKPEQRYLEIKNRYPNLLNRISQKQLASYLGITPVSLSRIKKRYEEKKGEH